MWTINGKQYDLTEYSSKHPGGEWVIRESIGHDVTYLFQSHHNFNRQQAERMLSRYMVSDKLNDDQPLIAWDPLMDKIHSDLLLEGIDHTRLRAPWWGLVYDAMIGCLYVWSVYVWFRSPSFTNAATVGVLAWVFCGFVQHEAGHSSLFRNPTLNCLFRYLSFPFVVPQQWFLRHNVLHHQFTNTQMDGDVQHKEGGIVRHHPTVEFRWWHTFQTISIGIGSVLFSFMYDPNSPFAKINVIQMSIVATHYWFHRQLMIGVAPFFVFSSVFIFITQLNHIQEDAFTLVLEKSPPNFALHQASSCVDYEHKNVFLSWIVSLCSIFLNYQTYHHLFPSISHFRYPELRPKLEKVLTKNGIRTKWRGLGEIVGSYYRYLWKLSNETQVPDSRTSNELKFD